MAQYNTSIQLQLRRPNTFYYILLPPIRRGCFQTNLRHTYDAVDVNTFVKWYYMETECSNSYLQQHRVPKPLYQLYGTQRQQYNLRQQHHATAIKFVWFTKQMLFAKTLYSILCYVCIQLCCLPMPTLSVFTYALTTKTQIAYPYV